MVLTVLKIEPIGFLEKIDNGRSQKMVIQDFFLKILDVEMDNQWIFLQ